ncbi:MAG: hypothetical protein IJ690_06395 [Clostridia bacterium]|nr:hypothetical protein [Clostridia bacterium]
MPVIITYGIYLPNGRFLPNGGDGHAKNANRFCGNYPELNDTKNSAKDLNPDEFLLCAGCAIVAGYRGERCFKVASNNDNSFINQLKADYEGEGYTIMPYWQIDKRYENVLTNTIKEIPKMQLVVKE